MYFPVRLDSTEYFGYNFGAFSFLFQKELYSFGGYGHWQYNGQLRHYIKEKAEWELEVTNKRIAYFKGLGQVPLVWFNYRTGHLWVGQSAQGHEGLSGQSSKIELNDTVYCLDMKTRHWTAGGIQSKSLHKLSKLPYVSTLATTPTGQLVVSRSENTVILLDYENNVLRASSSQKSADILRLLSEKSFVFYRSGWLFISRKDYQSADSVSLSSNDFELPYAKVYDGFSSRVAEKNSPKKALIVAGCVLFCVILVGLFIQIAKKRKSQQKRCNVHGFEGNEKLILQMFLEKAKRGESMTIDQVNQLLGISSKLPEVQKKHRSDLILSINEKWKLISGCAQLIQRIRNQNDRRSYEYTIQADQVEKLRNQIN